jgi:hypothetical protein
MYIVTEVGQVEEARYASSTWLAPGPISSRARAHPASPLAAVMVHDEIWLFWFDQQKRLQYLTSTYTTSTWSAVQNITEAPVPAELPRSLVVGRSDDPDATQVYYLDGTEMKQVQLTNNRWSSRDLGSSIPEWSVENGPLGAAGWNATAMRLYYLVDGEIREVAAEDVYGQWQVGTMVPDSY